MTWYPSAANSAHIYGEACKKLTGLRGQSLTQKKIFDIFGYFADSGDSTDDERSAFRRAVEDGWIIEESPGHFRVALFNKKEAEETTEADRTKIGELIQKTADEIKNLLLPKLQAKKLMLPFIMTGDDQYEKTERALILADNGLRYVILSPKGIFECSYSYRSCCPENSEHWKSRPLLWIDYGEQILIELARL